MKKVPLPNRLTWLAILGLGLLSIIVSGNWLNEQVSLAAQGRPPAPRPAFTGEPVSATLPAAVNLPTAPIDFGITGGGWQQVFTETFESGISPMIWTVFDADGTTNGEYKWGTETYTNTTPGGTRSAWGVGDGEQGGTLDPTVDGYPPNANSWMVYGPVDMSDVIDGMVMFNYWFQASLGDTLAIMASTNGTNYTGLATNNGGNGGWGGVMYNLGAYAGEPQLYIAFVFTSDSSTNPSNLKGAFVDDVIFAFNFRQNVYLPQVRLDFTPTPPATATPTVTPTPTQPSNPYVDDFNNSNSGWAMRRQSTGPTAPTNNVAYVLGGRLELNVGKSGQYLIAAPMVAAAASSKYNIETQAQLINPQDQSGYGIIFGGDWNGQTCPAGNYSSCFNSYYVLEVRWLANNNNPLLVARMRKITSHDSNNNPIGTIVFDWTEARTVNGVNINPNGVNEWDVLYENNGTIRVYVANQLFKTVTNETSLFNQKYFGLFASTLNEAGGTTNNSVVRYEYISVVPVP